MRSTLCIDERHLQVLDVDRMIVKTTTPSSKDHGMMGMENHPVIRTLYDHVDVGAGVNYDEIKQNSHICKLFSKMIVVTPIAEVLRTALAEILRLTSFSLNLSLFSVNLSLQKIRCVSIFFPSLH